MKRVDDRGWFFSDEQIKNLAQTISNDAKAAWIKEQQRKIFSETCQGFLSAQTLRIGSRWYAHLSWLNTVLSAGHSVAVAGANPEKTASELKKYFGLDVSYKPLIKKGETLFIETSLGQITEVVEMPDEITGYRFSLQD